MEGNRYSRTGSSPVMTTTIHYVCNGFTFDTYLEALIRMISSDKVVR